MRSQAVRNAGHVGLGVPAMLVVFASLLVGATAASAQTPAQQNKQLAAQDGTIPELEVPEALRLRHEAFIAEFTRATKEQGRVGDAARAIEKLAGIHFAKAKDAFPPLALLPLLAEGKVFPEMRKVVPMVERLKAGLPQIRREHPELIAGLKRIADAASDEGKTDYVRFTERLLWHIQEEEEVLYPAVLLVGAFVKEKLEKTVH